MRHFVARYRLTAIAMALVIWELIFTGVFFWANSRLMERDDFNWEHHGVLFIIYLIPALVPLHLFSLWKRNRAMKNLADARLFSQVAPEPSNVQAFVSHFLLRNALALGVIALANPQYGEGEVTAEVRSMDIMIALDLSNSMFAEDIQEGYSRLDVAKQAVHGLLNELEGEKIGLVIFAGEAYKVVPLTHDVDAVKMYLNEASPQFISAQGTSIGAAILRSKMAFDEESDAAKQIIVITDGEEHDAQAIHEAKQAHEDGIAVSVVGIGSGKPAPIPMKDANGTFIGFKKDGSGQKVRTTFNPQLIAQVAQEGGGVSAVNDELLLDLGDIVDEVQQAEHRDEMAKDFKVYIDRYQMFAFGALAMMFLYFFSTRERSYVLEKLGIVR